MSDFTKYDIYGFERGNLGLLNYFLYFATLQTKLQACIWLINDIIFYTLHT
jgi:hypothetical protein